MANRLARESSPYLLQHADNPVDWYPWGGEALEQARRENIPILLSIGYSACHWCHVMAHESFEDNDTAEVMNRLFINIKVDREERPDLDKIYQLAHSALTRRGGGWPLTMFLTPDQVPFFGGTYFPKTPRHGMPAFTDILQKVSEYLRSHPGDIDRQNESLLEFLDTLARADRESDAGTGQLLDAAANEIERYFDPADGGFGDAPKFPQTAALELAMRQGLEREQARLKHTAVFSLQKMAEGGIRDHLGGGFFRYSVDPSWTIPHFEKMLYDNGLLLDCYARAWRLTGEALFEEAAAGIADWLLADMQSPEGGFYAALDADSEGEEGRYYLWNPDEVRSILDEPDYTLFAGHYGLDREANFDGRWHLRVRRNPGDVAAELDMNMKAAGEILARARNRLLETRRRRTPPQRDEKILTGWNALTIQGLTVAGIHFDRSDWIDAARAALNRMRDVLWDGERLLAVHTAGQSRFNAYLDDYAFMLHAVLHALEAGWDSQLLEFAQSLADSLLRYFHDAERGGFFFTASDHEPLIHRPKTPADESTPAGAMIAARALHKLGCLTGHTGYLEAAASSVESAKGAMLQVPLGHAAGITALLEQHRPARQIIIRGDRSLIGSRQKQARSLCSPWTAVYAIDAGAADLPEALAQKAARGECTAYICEGTQCSAPVDDPDEFVRVLNNR